MLTFEPNLLSRKRENLVVSFSRTGDNSGRVVALALNMKAPNQQQKIKQKKDGDLSISSKGAMLKSIRRFKADHSAKNACFRRNIYKLDLSGKLKRDLTSIAQALNPEEDTNANSHKWSALFMDQNIDSAKETLKKCLLEMNYIKLNPQSEFVTKPQPQKAKKSSGHIKSSFDVISFDQLTLEILADYCNSSRETSKKFQAWLDTCAKDTAMIVGLRMSQDYKLFLCNQYGSYAVQKILQVDCQTVGYLEAFSKHNFYDLVLNAYASRVLQTLVEMSASFRLFVEQMFKADVSKAVSKMSIVPIHCLYYNIVRHNQLRLPSGSHGK